MVAGSQRYQRITAAFVLLVALIFSAQAAVAARKYAKPKKHFLSWESANAHDQMKPWRKIARPERSFEVRKRKVVRLKKPSFFDRKPVQFATPVHQDGQIFVGSTAGLFYAVDMRLNDKDWYFSTEGGIEAPAAVNGGSVYVGDIKGYAYSFDTASGRLNWKVLLGNEILGAPLVKGDRVYLVTMDGRLFALNRATGAELWHTDAMERQVGFTVRRQSSPIHYDGMIIYGTSRGTLVAYGEDANLVWVRMLGQPQSQVMDVDSRPLVVNGKIYATSADGVLFCLDPRDGNVLWSVGGGGANDLLYHDGKIYATGGGTLMALDPESGSVFWEQNVERKGISSPAGGKGYIAVVSTKDKLFLIDQINGDIVYDRFIRRGSYGDPIVVGDQLYVLANTSRVFSFEIHEKMKKQKLTKEEKAAERERKKAERERIKEEKARAREQKKLEKQRAKEEKAMREERKDIEKDVEKDEEMQDALPYGMEHGN